MTREHKTEELKQPLPVNSEATSMFSGGVGPIAYKLANFTVTAGATAAAITAAVSPLKALMLSHVANQTLVPPTLASSGRLPMLRWLYAGAFTKFSGSCTRAGYVTSAKETLQEPGHKRDGAFSAEMEPTPMRKQEGVEEVEVSEIDKSRSIVLSPLTGAAIFAAGDTFITTRPINKEALIKYGLKFNGGFYNNWVLGKYGIGLKYGVNLINIILLCDTEAKIAEKLPVESHFVAGGVCGAISAIVTAPLTFFSDKSLAYIKISPEGKLIQPPMFSATKQGINYIRSVGFVAATSYLGKQLAVQIPLKTASSAIIFSLVSGIFAALGEEPLAPARSWFERQRFFRQSSVAEQETNASTPTIEEIADDQPPSSGPIF